MATPYEPVRYKIGDSVLFLEFLPVPNLFFDGDYNTNSWLVWNFVGDFFARTFGAVRGNGFAVSVSGSNITIQNGRFWYKYFVLKQSTNVTLTGERTPNALEYLYVKLELKRNTIADDPAEQDPVFIRQNVNGEEVSRPNQYLYSSEYVVSSNGGLDNTSDTITTNVVDGEAVVETYYIRLATISTSNTVTMDLPVFGKVVNDVSALENSISSLQSEYDAYVASNNIDITALEGDVSTLQGTVAQLGTDLTTLESTVNSHIGNTSNPHNVTAAQLGITPGLLTSESETTFTSWSRYSNLTINHGFAGRPKFVQVLMVAKGTSDGYAVGDEVIIDGVNIVRPDSPQWVGIRVRLTSTQILLRVGNYVTMPTGSDALRELLDDSNSAAGYSIRVRAYY
ncbi:hypothetical protein Molly5_96 [Maribacter phage Molly_5]|uniref:Uncharacterized protein n=1 Tax=Maribacter phage Molly_1 TaxID=2745685 RepID=A0A8E4UYH5_9CAUD|nr:hypothetical protein M1M29_gp096 [Maribacter phage Molly_1]QQO97784.1 hypothetical protein Molly2_96 [Maribacter phage Molly_2]QQO97984.1 hypothetical protein Molly3_96 [Maribacter phage Molly_3]QQO98184.1 hypothetical protein Molly4_96 [Maribacter phage Molly_4]QQO98384.1 hypothetical protein Molly5_96 [Maribacter phage Molly_5]QQO97584.1 hypothetical protein Molly1_96 [Maribacter phage Molly_1]